MKREIELKGIEITYHRKVMAEKDAAGCTKDAPSHPLCATVRKVLEDRNDVLLGEIKSLQLGKAKNIDERFCDRRREIERKHEETLLKAAREKGGCFNGWYFRSARKRECYQLPNDYPKHFARAD